MLNDVVSTQTSQQQGGPLFSSLSFQESFVQSVKKQIASQPQIPFLDLLSQSEWQEILDQEGIQYRQRVFPPLITLWTFVSQVMSVDHSCRYAVAQWIAACLGQGRRACSSITSAYCRARQRLPESLFRRVALRLGDKLHSQCPTEWKWKGREVKIVDGSMLELPDTAANQSQYPQRKGQKKGLGFPTLRILTVVSLSCGALLEAAMSPLQGKETGEPALLRSLISSFRSGDVLLFDRYFSGYFLLALLVQRGIDVVVRQHHSRTQSSIKEVKRFSRCERIIAITRPFPRNFFWEQSSLRYEDFPPALLFREITFRIHRKGFRTRCFQIITSLLNPAQYSMDDILRLHAARWNIETDILNMKVGLQMDSLRCKTPSMIRKEVWTHLMAYNFIRLAATQAAALTGQTPRMISFQGTLCLLQTFRPILMLAPSPARWRELYLSMLQEVAKQHIGRRPGRYEPRVLKRRAPNTYPFLTTTRTIARRRRLLNKKTARGRYAKFARS